jgi:hypothetical protein
MTGLTLPQRRRLRLHVQQATDNRTPIAPMRKDRDPPTMLGWYLVVVVVGIAALLWGAG